jgi:hypothetical protein
MTKEQKDELASAEKALAWMEVCLWRPSRSAGSMLCSSLYSSGSTALLQHEAAVALVRCSSAVQFSDSGACQLPALAFCQRISARTTPLHSAAAASPLQEGKDIRFGDWTMKDTDWLNQVQVRPRDICSLTTRRAAGLVLWLSCSSRNPAVLAWLFEASVAAWSESSHPHTRTQGKGTAVVSRITQPPYACACTACPLAPPSQFLSAKPVVYLVNLSERDYQRKKNKWLVKLFEWVKAHGGDPIIPFRWVRWLLKHIMLEAQVKKFQDNNRRIDILTVVGTTSVGVSAFWCVLCVLANI